VLLEKCCLVYLLVLILVCVVDFDILRFCWSGCFMCVVAPWFDLAFVCLVIVLGIFGLVCLVSWVLMVRMLSSGPFCSWVFRIICTF